MTILVTGGAGYIGSHTCVDLLLNGFDVIVVDNLVNSKARSLQKVQEIAGKSLKFIQADITKKEELRSVFEENRISSVIHLAGLKSANESISQPLKYYYNNIVGTIVLCSLMSEYNVKKMVFSSSATVYGKNNQSPLSETLPLEATNPYGWSKVLSENILRDLYQADRSWSISILRYFNPVGAHESGLIGENPLNTPENLMPFITQVALGKQDKVIIYGDDYATRDGTGIRDYIHVMDLSKGHIMALEKTLQNPGVDEYNLGTGIGFTVLEIIRAFESANRVAIPYVISSRRAGDIDVSYADATKALVKLNWKAERTLEDMCRDAWKWQLRNPSGY
jgi:UDP-glucose 4-epimerase